LSPSHGVSYQDLIPAELRGLDEAALDRALLIRGLGFIAEDPGRYLLLSLSRIPVFFLFWPTSDSTLLSNASRVLSFGLFLPFMLLGLFLVIRELPALRGCPERWGSRTDSFRTSDAACRLQYEFILLFLTFIVSYTAVHLASWAHVRYRLPVDAFLVFFAACAIDWLWERESAQRRKMVVHA